MSTQHPRAAAPAIAHPPAPPGATPAVPPVTLRGARAAASRAGGPVLRARTPDRGVGDPAVEGDLTLDRTPDGVGPDEALDTSPDTVADALLDTVAGGAVGPTGRPLPHFPEPPVLHHHGPARVVAMCNQKGGVGKTTSTINLGASLAGYGRRVLLVDFDPQGALSVGLGVNPHERDLSVYNVLMERSTSAADVLLKTNVPGMDLLPSNIDLSAAEVQLVSEVAREHVLRRALAPLLPEYDVVLVDCQPSLGLLTINALTAADGVIVPLECEFFALRGVALLQETIDKVGERLNERLVIDGLLATMYDSRTVHAREVVHRLVEAFGDKVFHTVVSRTVRFPESTVAQTPITSYAPASPGADAYRTLAREVLHRWDS